MLKIIAIYGAGFVMGILAFLMYLKAPFPGMTIRIVGIVMVHCALAGIFALLVSPPETQQELYERHNKAEKKES